MWLFARLTSPARSLREIFGLDWPRSNDAHAVWRGPPRSKPYVAAVVVLLLAAVGSTLLDEAPEAVPARKPLIDFPLALDGWEGRTGTIDDALLARLKLSDYLLVDFSKPDHPVVNLYVAYYGSQRAGTSAHSPRACIPGGGWSIEGLSTRSVPGAGRDASPLLVNRVAIRKGRERTLVYYWFEQRGRKLTSEYLVKWYLFWDALTRHRSDGALVRLTTRVGADEDPLGADRRLAALVREVAPELPDYVPD
jgi:EpsI family protein